MTGVDARDPKKAIPWLLLNAASTAPGPRGDQFVKTTFIQRVNTKGGLAPTTSCTANGQAGRGALHRRLLLLMATGKAGA